jgi:hypothetical protein
VPPLPELPPITLLDGFDPLAGLVDVGIYPLPLSGLEHLGIAGAPAAPPVRRPAVRASARRAQGRPLRRPARSAGHSAAVARALRPQRRAPVPRAGLAALRGQSAASAFEVLALVAEGRDWTFSASPSDFHPWAGVAFLPVATTLMRPSHLSNWNVVPCSSVASPGDRSRLAAQLDGQPVPGERSRSSVTRRRGR